MDEVAPAIPFDGVMGFVVLIRNGIVKEVYRLNLKFETEVM